MITKLEEGGEVGNPVTIGMSSTANISIECNSITLLIDGLKEEEEVCSQFRGDLMGDFAQNAIPILFPFVIEYVLIGASVALIMANHIGRWVND